MNAQVQEEQAKWIDDGRKHCLDLTVILCKLEMGYMTDWSYFKSALYRHWINRIENKISRGCHERYIY